MKAIKINSMWCPSCIIMKPIFEQLADELAIDFTSFDYDLDEAKIVQYNIGKILPVLIFFDDMDQELIRFIGEKKKSEILNKLKEVGNK